MVFARTTLIIASPHPVTETPPTELSAYVPAPMIGESPTRPGYLFNVPPVDVPTQIFPLLSNATAPTVSLDWLHLRNASFELKSSRCFSISQRFCSRGVTSSSGRHAAILYCIANRSAPSPT